MTTITVSRGIRFPTAQLEHIDRVCLEAGITSSEFVRQASAHLLHGVERYGIGLLTVPVPSDKRGP